MTTTFLIPQPSQHPLSEYVHRLETGETLLHDSPENLVEVVGILHSYGIVLDAYSRNLIYIGENAFLEPFPFFKYFNGEITPAKLLRYIWHDRINFEYAEYCMRSMLWHGSDGLDNYLHSPEFAQGLEKVISAKFRNNPFMQGWHKLFPAFFPEQISQLTSCT